MLLFPETALAVRTQKSMLRHVEVCEWCNVIVMVMLGLTAGLFHPLQKSLGIQFATLNKKMKSAPKFTPEWTLAKVEMKLIAEELGYLSELIANKNVAGEGLGS